MLWRCSCINNLARNIKMELQAKLSKKRPTKIEDMSKEQIRQAILKKRECNAKALSIVESLLEKGITEPYFIQCLPDINQSHFDDVIEERAIIHLCGYPICSKTISEREIPKQKYRISVKTNKVYDITARKSFCSNSCYKSAMYAKKQMLTSPLWFREYEEIPKFQLLPLNTVGSLGQEVDLAIVQKISIKTTKEVFTINDFASASLSEITGDLPHSDSKADEETSKELNESAAQLKNNKSKTNIADKNLNKASIEIDSQDIKNKVNSSDKCSDSSEVVNELNENLIAKINQEIKQKPESKQKPETSKAIQKKSIPNPKNIVGEIIEKPERKIDPILINTPDDQSPKKYTDSGKKLLQKKQPSVTVIAIEVEKCLAEWFTLDTLLFLFGEEKVKEMVANKGESIKEYLNNYAKSIFYNSNTYDQYQALCRKLNMVELEEKRQNAQALQRETKPLPDYSILQAESKAIQLKVKAFYHGETDIPEVEMSKEKTREDGDGTQLPLVDKNAQNALRRRIVCEQLNKVLPDLLCTLGLVNLSISSDIRLIVNTFRLKANNIMFKPIQWTLIAIVIIKLLSFRDRRLEYLLESPMTYKHMQLLLLSYKQDGGYLERLISWLTDVDRLLDTNDTQLTIE